MAFCTNCGSKIDDEARFCPDCGAPVVPEAPKAEPWEEEKKDFGTKINELNNTPDTSGTRLFGNTRACSALCRKGIEICALPHESGTCPRDSPVCMDVR